MPSFRIIPFTATGVIGALAASAALAADPAHEVWLANDERAFHRGVVDAVVATFTADAVVRGVPECPNDNPCVGREPLRERWIKPLVANNLRMASLDARSEGDTLRARMEARLAPGGVVNAKRVVLLDRFVLRGGQASLKEITFDTSDAETAQVIGAAPAR